MRLFDLFGRSRSRCAPRPRSNRVRCAVERLESRLVLSTTTDLGLTTLSAIVPPSAPPTAPLTNGLQIGVAPVIGVGM
jgi:hypothetical protein